MSLRTRIDGRTRDNNLVQVRGKEGEVLAEIRLVDQSSITLEVSTKVGLYLEKPNGWKSAQHTTNT